MQLEDWRLLLEPAGQSLLAEATARQPTPETLLKHLTDLRRRHPSGLVSAALETAMLRRRAADKFERAGSLYWTAEALEQASGERIAAHRAERFWLLGVRRLGDLGCGAGGDALVLAAGAWVLGVDRDELRLSMARENCRAYGREAQFQPLLADLHGWTPTGLDALFFDPGRRAPDGRRIHSVAHYRPPLAVIENWLPRVPNLAVKVSPGVDDAELPPGAEVEFVSERGLVKEAVLWFGDLRTRAGRRATLLPGPHSLTDEDRAPVDVGRPGPFLYEPDGAVIRAHLVEQLAARLGAKKLDPQIAYLTSHQLTATPFATAYQIDEWMPFQLKRLRARLRSLDVGRVVVKKRGSPLDPAELAHRLRLTGQTERVLFLTRVDGGPAVLIGRSLQAWE